MAMWAGKLKHDSSKGNGKSGYKEKDKLFSSLSILSIFSTNAELQWFTNILEKASITDSNHSSPSNNVSNKNKYETTSEITKKVKNERQDLKSLEFLKGRKEGFICRILNIYSEYISELSQDYLCRCVC